MKSNKSKCPIPRIHFFKLRMLGKVKLQRCDSDIPVSKCSGVGFWGWIRASEIGTQPEISSASGIGAFIKALFVSRGVLRCNTNAKNRSIFKAGNVDIKQGTWCGLFVDYLFYDLPRQPCVLKSRGLGLVYSNEQAMLVIPKKAPSIAAATVPE